MDAELLQVLALDKITTVGLLLAGIIVVWRRYAAASDRLLSEVKAQTIELAQLRASVDAGLEAIKGQVASHGVRLDRHEQRLNRHSRLLSSVGARSGQYPRLAIAEDDAE